MTTQTAAVCSLTHQPMLQLGDRNDAVVALTKLLLNSTIIVTTEGDISGELGVSDRFTHLVKEVVQAFQTQVFLEPDGVVGPKTWKALCADAPVHMPVISRGAEGEAVRRLQMRLGNGCRMDRESVDGIFGSATEADVKNFQQTFRLAEDAPVLVVDGIVGPQTWLALSKFRSDECV